MDETPYQIIFIILGTSIQRLRVLLDKMKVSGLLHDATIVISEDHGSRISMSHFGETMSKRDFIDNYGTLFSIHAPSVEPLYDLRFASSQRLFTEFFAPRQIKRGNDIRNHSVVVYTLEGDTVELKCQFLVRDPRGVACQGLGESA